VEPEEPKEPEPEPEPEVNVVETPGCTEMVVVDCLRAFWTEEVILGLRVVRICCTREAICDCDICCVDVALWNPWLERELEPWLELWLEDDEES